MNSQYCLPMGQTSEPQDDVVTLNKNKNGLWEISYIERGNRKLIAQFPKLKTACLYPRVALMDPTLTLSVPKDQTASEFAISLHM